MSLDVDGVRYATAVLEGKMGWAVDETHRPAMRVFVGHEDEAIPTFPEIRLAIILFCSFFYRLL